ncbi:hypothetical protein MRB53_016031 [Persea americana]|uniref:Uncharacterized protein n=1 Tax=Persea americana TaxID=3435 RepID=A0ACC2M0Y0_PERAE|nr:hypothetical protein MRB53_016031 [Persea americana]
MPSSNFSVFNVSIAPNVAGTNLNPICSCNNSDSSNVASNINDSSNSPDMLSGIVMLLSNVLDSRNRLVVLKCDGMVKALNISDSSDRLGMEDSFDRLALLSNTCDCIVAPPSNACGPSNRLLALLDICDCDCMASPSNISVSSNRLEMLKFSLLPTVIGIVAV